VELTAVAQHVKQTAIALLIKTSLAFQEHVLLRQASVTSYKYKVAVIQMMIVMTATSAQMTYATTMNVRIQIIKILALTAMHALMTFAVVESA